MNTEPTMLDPSRRIAGLLSELRSQIRRYVFIDGLCLALIWVAGMFWCVMALDYLPVLVGYGELPIWVRGILLAGNLIGVGWISWKWIASRSYARLGDASLALLIERKHLELRERLITSVELEDAIRSREFDSKLLAETRNEAAKMTMGIAPGSLLNRSRLFRQVALATAGIVSLGLFAVFSSTTAGLAVRRQYLLSSQAWPRKNELAWASVKVKYDRPISGIPEFAAPITPRGGVVRVGRGSTVTLNIDSLSQSPDGRELTIVPSCQVNYWTDDGLRGKQLCKRIGTAREGAQKFSVDGQPFDPVLSTVHFRLRGGDFLLAGLKLEVVDNPTIVSTKLDCRFPTYMVDEDSLRWTPRVVDWSPGSGLPVGTAWTLVCTCNKPVQRIHLVDVASGEIVSQDANGERFEITFPKLTGPVTKEIYIVDQDGVLSPTPHVVAIDAIVDQPPQIELTLNGIGTAITSQAFVPVSGAVRDDYGVGRAWLEIDDRQRIPLEIEMALSTGGKFDTSVDFRQLAQRGDNPWPLPTSPGSKITVVAKSTDRCDLDSDGQISVGKSFELELVTANQLVKILERAEAAERRRLEQIAKELGEARGYLVRCGGPAENVPTRLEPGESTAPSTQAAMDLGSPANGADMQFGELRLLYAQRAAMQLDKSAGEIAGVASSLDHIRLQVINNRLDTHEREIRLREQIVMPLRSVADRILGETRKDVLDVQEQLKSSIMRSSVAAAPATGEIALKKSLESLDAQMIRLNQVIALLLKFETQNELLDLVRQIIDQQDSLLRETKQERQKRAFDGLIDD